MTGQSRRSALRRLAIWRTVPPLLVGTIAAAPKNMAYAAPSRLALVVATIGLLCAGLRGTALARRRYQELTLREHYGATNAEREGAAYLINEQRWARRGITEAAVGAVLLGGGCLVAQWPQLGILSAAAPVLGTAAAVGALAVPALAFRNRSHWINARFLRRYLNEMAAERSTHVWYPPGNRVTLPAVQVTGEGSFTIGGFPFAFPDFLGTICLGQSGAGKTITLLNSILEGMITSFGTQPGAVSGLIVDAKGDFRAKLVTLLQRVGRADDLVIFDPARWSEAGGTTASIAWNPLDNEESPLELARGLITVLAMQGHASGAEGTYFQAAATAFIETCIVLLRAAGRTATLLDILQLLQEPDDQPVFYHQLLHAISAAFPGELPAEVRRVIVYMERNWGVMADREKSAARGSLHELLFEFLGHPFAEIFGGSSTISITDIIDQGKILYVDMPASRWPRMGAIIVTLLKLEMQRQILLRPRKTKPSFFLADEFQLYFSNAGGQGDAAFFERSRESNHANVVATQSLSALMRSQRGEHELNSFLVNCPTKFFMRSDNKLTAQTATVLFGTRSETGIAANEQAAFGKSGGQKRHTSYSRSKRTVARVPEDALLGLAVPDKGDPDRHFSEAFVHLGTRPVAEQFRLILPVNPLE